MNTQQEKHQVPTLLLEKLALGELNADEQQRLDHHVTASEQLRLGGELRQRNAEFLVQNPADAILSALRLKQQAARFAVQRQRRARLVASVAVAAAIALLLLTRPWRLGDGDTLLKGDGPHLIVYRQAADAEGDVRLHSNDLANQGEVLQLRYAAGGFPYGIIVSVDGAGTVTLHFPASTTQSTALTGQGESALPYAYELDGAPGYERFLFIVSRRPLPVAAILRKAQGAAALSAAAAAVALGLPQDAVVTTFVLKKPMPKP